MWEQEGGREGMKEGGNTGGGAKQVTQHVKEKTNHQQTLTILSSNVIQSVAK